MPRLRSTPWRALGAVAACAALLPPGALPASANAASAPGASVAAAPAAAARPQADDILTRLRALPGFTVTEVSTGVPEGFRFFTMEVTQPVDHDHPARGTFTQRVTLLHRDVARPTVFFTSGYNVSTKPGRSEPTRIVDGNQVSMEYRFFTPSRPAHPDWKRELTIRQAAADQHRIFAALKPIYSRNWIATGGSKGGMTATYYRYFFPRDMNGTVPYVAPNDVVNDKDVYNSFLDRVGTKACRDDITAVQRRMLGQDRAWFLARLESAAKEAKATFSLVGSAERALEVGVVDSFFAFWQYQPATACGRVPDARDATREEIWAWQEAVNPLLSLSDQQVEAYVPYYYQAAAQLGWPEPYERRLRDLLKWPGLDQAPSFVPAAIRPKTFDRAAMPAVDRWVRTQARQMLFVDGSLDPWSAEPFDCGARASARKRDCQRFVVKGGNHGSTIQQLPARERDLARARIQAWAGLGSKDATVQRKQGLGVPGLDRAMVQRRPAM